MTPKLVDSHAHLNFNAYKDDGSEVIRRALDQGIWMINVGSQHETSKRAVEVADSYAVGVYAAIGLHPIHLSAIKVDEEEIKFKSREESFNESRYQHLIDEDKQHKIVAVGEIGLDYFHLTENTPANLPSGLFSQVEGGSPEGRKTQKARKPESLVGQNGSNQIIELQKSELIKQLKFAEKNNLPVILHCRGSQLNPLDAYQDLLNLIKLQITDYRLRITGVVHCYGANLDIAKEFIQLGFYLGFTGVITFGKNAEDLRQVVRQLPLDKILVETDCPYLAPDPYRGQRNEPSYVKFVVRKIAEIKGIDFEEVAAATTKNAWELFHIK